MTTFIVVLPGQAEASCRKCTWTFSGEPTKVNLVAKLHREKHNIEERS